MAQTIETLAPWMGGLLSAGVLGIVGWNAHRILEIPVIKQELNDLKVHVETQLEDIKKSVQRIENFLLNR